MSKFNGVLVIFCFLVVLSIFTGVASAATWTVNPGDSIQSVVDNASDNDTVIINDDNGSAYTYSENVVVNKKLSIQAKNSSNVTKMIVLPIIMFLFLWYFIFSYAILVVIFMSNSPPCHLLLKLQHLPSEQWSHHV
jgi:ATP-dependent Zn protease